MRCESVSLQLAEIADGLNRLPADAERHVDSCLRCQAELVQYRRLLRALTSLRYHYVAPDDSLLEDILAALRPPATVHRLHRRSRRAAYIGGIAAAAATAGAAGAIVIASRLASRQSLAS
jgi:anti-sigma factor RsiW